MQDYRILEAANGFQVLELLSQKPDLILLDVAMPLLEFLHFLFLTHKTK